MRVEHAAPVELRLAADNPGLIEGYAAVWGARDAFGDVLRPGAFTRSLAAHSAAGTRPLMLRNHDPDRIIGAWQTVIEDAKGLRVAGALVLENRDGADAHALLRAGAMDGLSIGFRTVKAAPGSGGRIVHDVELIEVSLVGRPAQPLARITAVRSDAGFAPLLQAIRHATARLRGT
jgi:HK97 family phage prohead protease